MGIENQDIPDFQGSTFSIWLSSIVESRHIYQSISQEGVALEVASLHDRFLSEMGFYEWVQGQCAWVGVGVTVRWQTLLSHVTIFVTYCHTSCSRPHIA